MLQNKQFNSWLESFWSVRTYRPQNWPVSIYSEPDRELLIARNVVVDICPQYSVHFLHNVAPLIPPASHLKVLLPSCLHNIGHHHDCFDSQVRQGINSKARRCGAREDKKEMKSELRQGNRHSQGTHWKVAIVVPNSSRVAHAHYGREPDNTCGFVSTRPEV